MRNINQPIMKFIDVLVKLLLVISLSPLSPAHTDNSTLNDQSEKRLTCPLIRKFASNSSICTVTRYIMNETGTRVGEGTICLQKNLKPDVRFKCFNGIWIQITGKMKRQKRAFCSLVCPSDINATAPQGKSCAIVNWTAPNSSLSNSGGNDGDCFPNGSTVITYYSQGWFFNRCTCSFKIIIKVHECEPLAPFLSGQRECSGADARNVWGTVCQYTCNPGYQLKGTSSQTCEVKSESADWSSSSPKCEEICSWPRSHCWPGDCHNLLATNCICRAGFVLQNETGAPRCEVAVPPDIKTCRVSVVDETGDITNTSLMEDVELCDNQTYGSIRLQPSIIRVHLKADLNLTVGPLPQYVSESQVGVSNAQVIVVKVSNSGKEAIILQQTLNSMPLCSANVNSTHPVPSGLHLECHADIRLPTVNLMNGESICADLAVFSGGYYNLVDSNSLYRGQVLFQLVERKHRTCFVYDSQKPIHCFETGCSKDPLQLSHRITRAPRINVQVDGWIDPFPVGSNTHASLIEKYKINVYNVDVGLDTLLVQDNAIEDNSTEWLTGASYEGPYVIDVTLPKDNPRLYAIILEVHDHAGNVGYARRLVMFDNSSTIQITESHRLNVISAIQGSDTTWQTGTSRNVCVDWRGRFYNNMMRFNNYLKPVSIDTRRQLYSQYDQIHGILSINGTDNIDGVIKFELSWGLAKSASIPFEDVVPALSLAACFMENLTDGDTGLFRIRASDIMGNTKEDSVQVNIDHSPPEIKILLMNGTFEPGGLYINDSSELSSVVLLLQVTDQHSGIKNFQWALNKHNQSHDVSNGTIPVLPLQNGIDCQGKQHCYCPLVGSCEIYQHQYMFIFREVDNNNINNNNASTFQQRYDVSFSATNHAGIPSIDTLAIFVEQKTTSWRLVIEGLKKVTSVNEEGKVDHVGTILGAAFGVLLLIAVVICLAVFYWKRRIQKKVDKPDTIYENTNAVQDSVSNTNFTNSDGMEMASGGEMNYDALQFVKDDNCDESKHYSAFSPDFSKQQNSYTDMPRKCPSSNNGDKVGRKILEPTTRRTNADTYFNRACEDTIYENTNLPDLTRTNIYDNV